MNRAERRKAGKTDKGNKTLVFNSYQAAVDFVMKGPAQVAMREEIDRQILDRVDVVEKDVDAAILWSLHRCFGFGKKRLEEFYRFFLQEYHRVREVYQIDECYPERYKLMEIGVDVDELRERYSDGINPENHVKGGE